MKSKVDNILKRWQAAFQNNQENLESNRKKRLIADITEEEGRK
jgi:hypothetical protein